jgi:uncharacterized protein YjbI with pentapeptide repeats
MSLTEEKRADAADTALDMLKKEHLQLKQTVKGRIADPNCADEIRQFIARARATGAVLSDKEQRKEAQSILDFWTTELIRRPGATAKDFAPAILARSDVKLPAQPDEQLGRLDTESTERSRQAIRLGAVARLWRDSGKKRGYLLVGDAITQAAEFRGFDPDIDDLVIASEDRRRLVRLLVSSSIVTFILTVVTCMTVFFWGLPGLSSLALSKLRNPISDQATKTNSLRTLHYVQPFLPSHTSSLDISNVDLRDLNMNNIALDAPNFAYSGFANTNLQNATLRGASFHTSQIGVGTSFKRTNLRSSQFEFARITSSSFIDAELQRASFDDAQICDVSFSGADLRGATFRQTIFADDFAGYFKNTAWWLAAGWNSKQLKELAEIENADLEKSYTFNKELDNLKGAINKLGPGSYERAFVLNDMAWTLATYGFNLGDVGVGSTSPEDRCHENTGIPASAALAAKQAVCIVEQLNQSGPRRYAASEEANFRDTLGYIVLQLASPGNQLQAAEAAKYINVALQGISQNLSGESLFRYAVAQYASGRKEDALATLREAMDSKQYVPSHELIRLKAHITGDLKTEIYSRIDLRRPTPHEDRHVVCSKPTGAPPTKNN